MAEIFFKKIERRTDKEMKKKKREKRKGGMNERKKNE